MPASSGRRPISSHDPSDLDRYRAKRDFRKTPEPIPDGHSPSSSAEFVVHRHEARRLHYDLRLQVEGVLASWAVPKGLSYDPSDKRLAVRTEDHPLAYLDFEGVIPAAEYGGGTMMIWDRGHYSLLRSESAAAQLEQGKLELLLDGGRFRGEWHLVRTKKNHSDWLLFKSRDRYARGKEERPFPLDLSRLPRASQPQRLRRMTAARKIEPFQELGWLYELDLTGRRLFAERQGDEIRFRGLTGKVAARAVGVIEALKQLKAETAILDGVLVCLDDRQHPSSELLEEVLSGRVQRPLDYYAFDLLYYDAWDLRPLPLIERKAALASILPGHQRLIYVDHERSRAWDLFQSVAALGLDGCIAKRTESTYRGGPSDAWVRVRIPAPSTSEVRPRTQRRGHLSRRPRVTNRDKVLWPRDGFTKGDLIDYYEVVADFILPYLADRPLSLHRFPNGIEADSFYQKRTAEHFPDWIRTIPIRSQRSEEKTIEYVVCEDRETLLYLANLACIELHPWSSCCTDLDEPTWAIFDLDPATSDFSRVTAVARYLGKLLRGIGLRPCLKTSGAKGLHLYLPLTPGYTYDQVRMFCEGVARYTAEQKSDIATVERAKEQRGGRVYIDYLQNRRGQTVVSPYSVRPVPAAQVSMPLDWDELSEIRPSDFTIESAPSRLELRGDLFRGALVDRQNLLPAIEAFQDLAQQGGGNRR